MMTVSSGLPCLLKREMLAFNTGQSDPDCRCGCPACTDRSILAWVEVAGSGAGSER